MKSLEDTRLFQLDDPRDLARHDTLGAFKTEASIHGPEMATRTVSNAERKRQARAKLLVEQQRAQKAEEGSITSFRMEELYWKNRTDEPGWDLAFYDNSKAIQWHSDLDQPASDDGQAGSWTDRSGSVWRVQKWKLANDKAAYCFPDNPGE